VGIKKVGKGARCQDFPRRKRLKSDRTSAMRGVESRSGCGMRANALPLT